MQKKSDHISENITELFKKVKKGSRPFRRVLNRIQDFISKNKLKSWKKALKNEEVEQETVRSAHRTTNWTFFGTEVCDTRLRLLTRKTLFKKQIELIHNNNNRYYKNSKKANILIEEDLSHALAECKSTKDTFSDILNSLGFLRLKVFY